MGIHQPMGTDPHFALQEYDPLRLPAEFKHDWLLLEDRALEPNVYLSPHFILPALETLTPTLHPTLFAVYAHTQSTHKLVGLALFVLSGPDRSFPLRHLVAYQSPHSYLSGMLIDKDCSAAVVRRVFEHLQQPCARWHGVRLNNWLTTGPQGTLMLSVAASLGIPWHALYAYERAVLRPASVDEALYQASVARAGGKDLERRIRRLRELGDIRSRVLWGSDVTDASIDTFLALEDREWAHQQKTSLLAAGHEGFFRQVCTALRAESRVFISELLLNGQAIASAINFRSGNQGFAFKIGWDQTLAKVSPGIINELWFLREVKQSCAQLALIDSGASSGSFIDKVWPERTTITSGIFITSRRGKLVTVVLQCVRAAKQRMKNWRGAPKTADIPAMPST